MYVASFRVAVRRLDESEAPAGVLGALWWRWVPSRNSYPLDPRLDHVWGVGLEWRPYTPIWDTKLPWYTEVVIVCSRCGRQFKRLEELFEHLRLHVGSSKRIVVKVEVA